MSNQVSTSSGLKRTNEKGGLLKNFLVDTLQTFATVLCKHFKEVKHQRCLMLDAPFLKNIELDSF